jgi:uncharacterized protein with PQ loop repeat
MDSEAATDVRNQLKAISVTATGTLATFGGLVMALPFFDFWAKVLPSPGKYDALARVVGVLLSALLAHREVSHEWPTRRWELSDIRPSGVPQVMIGGLLTLIYLATQGMSLGGWADLLHAVAYCGIVILLSFGFIRLAKKAYDFSTDDVEFAKLRAEREKEAERLRDELQQIASGAPQAEQVSSSAPQTEQVSSDDIHFMWFAMIFYAGITAVITGFVVLNQIIAVLPPIIRNAGITNALSVLIAIILIGSNYTSVYLERNLTQKGNRDNVILKGRLEGRNVVESGIGPVLMGAVCLVLFVAVDANLQGKPSDNVLVETFLIILQIGFFAFVAYGLWRFSVSEHERSKKRIGR